MNMSWKWGACALTIAAILTGCSSTEATETMETIRETDSQEQKSETTETTEGSGVSDPTEVSSTSGDDETLESGTVPLTVWAEEDDFEMLEEMITSFQEHYAGQASFEINLMPQADSGTCNMVP